MTFPLTKQQQRGHLAMIVFACLVAGSYSFGARVADKIDPTALTALRFGVGACVMVSLSIGMGIIKRADLNAPWRYVILGFLMALFFVLMFEALRVSVSVSVSAVFTLTPLMSALFGWLLLRQITTRANLAALLIGAGGAIWVIFRADVSAILAFDIGPGEAAFFFGCVAHSLYTPLVPMLNRGQHPVVMTAGMLVAGAILLCLYAGPSLLDVPWVEFSVTTWFIIAYLSLITTSFTFFLVQFAALRLPASKVMAYTYLTPSMVILYEGLLRSGWPPMGVAAGVGLTLLALFKLLKG